MQVPADPVSPSPAPLKVILFVDRRPSNRDRIQSLRTRLDRLQADFPLEVQVVDVSEQPYMAEHFKLIATPALVKLYPEPRQSLMGIDLAEKLETWWPRWKQSALEALHSNNNGNATGDRQLDSAKPAQSSELLRLSDEIFRLEREHEELQELIRFKDRAIQILVHDLRNPLAAASVAVETLESGEPGQRNQQSMNGDMRKRLFQHARGQLRCIDTMVEGLLQIGWGSSETFRITPQKVDLNELCQLAIATLRDRLEAKRQVLELDIPQDLPSVHADPERIVQVIINLLDNAIKYTPEEGQISVAALHRTSQKVQVSIRDTGPGIPEDKQRQIFEDRFRLQRDRSSQGYGIGLHLCHRTIRAHFGQIWVDSRFGQGSCFHFTLPIHG